jgi:signal peptidase I
MEGDGSSDSLGERRAKRSSVLGDLSTLVLAIGAALVIRTFVVQSFYVPSDSMLPTMLVGDHVFVNKLVYGLKVPFADRRSPGFREPKRGEVVVFRLARARGQLYPVDHRRDLPRENFVKRIVGLPGDRVEVRDGELILNGEIVPSESSDETFMDSAGNVFDMRIETIGECRHYVLDHPSLAGIDMPEITVKPGRYLFLGDNRDNSHDGRRFGTVRLEDLEGPAGLLYWSWDWNGRWAELLNPATWWNNLLHRTRWDRKGRFHACLPEEAQL